jgi:hypothetical protein
MEIEALAIAGSIHGNVEVARIDGAIIQSGQRSAAGCSVQPAFRSRALI